jgi:hypothetical protein
MAMITKPDRIVNVGFESIPPIITKAPKLSAAKAIKKAELVKFKVEAGTKYK